MFEDIIGDRQDRCKKAFNRKCLVTEGQLWVNCPAYEPLDHKFNICKYISATSYKCCNEDFIKYQKRDM